MKRNNKGLTLVELIVAMAIISIITVIIGLSVSASSSAKTEKTAASVDALISKCRAGCLGRAGDVHLTISLDGTDIVCDYYEDGAVVSTDTFSGSGIAVSYIMTPAGSEAGTTTVLSESTSLTLSFHRSTGSLTAQAGSYCTSISFTGGRTYTIELFPITGAHRLA
ncbi:MAG: prepilin-type N-terminal cleavage/methylation domain-containing protein [Erysipelotrichales bacterium]|nr:prepilin-type N-terminal cleavage/methylation domain-containing protein [Erysipelotrichales bacterium]